MKKIYCSPELICESLTAEDVLTMSNVGEVSVNDLQGLDGNTLIQ